METRKILVEIRSKEALQSIALSMIENGFYFLKEWDNFYPKESIEVIFLLPDKSKFVTSAVVKESIKDSGSMLEMTDISQLKEFIGHQRSEEEERQTTYSRIRKIRDIAIVEVGS